MPITSLPTTINTPADHGHTATGDGGTVATPELLNYIQATNVVAPGTPAAGKSRIFVRSSDKVLCTIDEAGLVKPLVDLGTTRTANTFLAGPASGGAAAATWRAPVPADMAATPSDGQVLASWGGALKWMSVPPWIQKGANVRYAAYGDGNPAIYANLPIGSQTGANYGSSIGYAIKFVLPVALSVTHVYVPNNGVTVGCWNFAIYPVGSATTKTWDSGAIDGTANAWLDVTTSTPFTLNANTDYWWCMSSPTASASGSVYAPNHGISNTVIIFGADAAPYSGALAGIASFVNFAVTAGAFPGTLPSIVATATPTRRPGMALLFGTAS